MTIDTELSIKLPENSNAFLATKFEGQEVQKIIGWRSRKSKCNRIKKLFCCHAVGQEYVLFLINKPKGRNKKQRIFYLHQPSPKKIILQGTNHKKKQKKTT